MDALTEYRTLTTAKSKHAFLDSLAIDLDWASADTLYRKLRERLESDSSWRLGGPRVRNIFRKYSQHAETYLGRAPKRFLDFGAGVFQPLGYSFLFWLHGAELCVALDNNRLFGSSRADYLEQRSAKSLWDIACEVMANPDGYGLESFDRIFELDALALKRGALEEGLRGTPLKRHFGIVQDLEEGEFDFVTSQAVLEHVADFDDMAETLFARTAIGGIHFHDVDFRDHRSFKQKKFSKWDFLYSDEGDGGACNRMRYSEVCSSFKKAGFEIIASKPRRETPPADIRDRMAPQFASLTDDDLAITGAEIFLRRS